MIKIEFKEAIIDWNGDMSMFCFIKDKWTLNQFKKNINEVSNKVLPYTPTQDPYLDRSFILQQLGISKEQDEQIQLKYSNK